MKPHRSILSVPGHVAKMHGKAAASAADVVMLDLEDSVPPEARENARKQVIASLLEQDWGNKTVTVRINGLATPFGWRDLLEVAEQAGEVLDAVVIPKVNGPADVHFADRLLAGLALEKGRPDTIGIEAIIESAEALVNVQATAMATMTAAGANTRVRALVFGIADYSASIGARLVSISGHGEGEEAIYPGHRWHFPMSRLVMHARAAGCLAIDTPYGNFKDMEGLRRSAAMACALGFDGKWAIHPAQIEVINEVFSPSPADIERAARIIEANEAAKQAGRGAVALDGRMVDQATVKLAEKVWDQARQMGLV